MGINSIDNNKRIFTGANKSVKFDANPQIYTSAPGLIGDKVEFANIQDKKTASSSVSELKNQLNETKEKQGLIRKLWDGVKNLTHLGAGSNKAERAIEKLEKGEITEEEAFKAVEGYQKGQEMCVDVVADVASGILAVGAFALAVPTGGASLLAGLGAATAVGAGVKVAIKGGDALLTGKEYSGKNLLYDTATGSINGLLAPVTNGIGASLTKTVGAKLGLTVVKEGAEEIVEQGVKQTLAQGFKSMVINQSVDVVGGTVTKRALALGTGMAVDGALSGAGDNMVRATLNGEDFFEAGVEGAIGGLIMAPVIGGGMRMAAKGAGKIIARNADNVQGTRLQIDMDGDGAAILVRVKQDGKLNNYLDINNINESTRERFFSNAANSQNRGKRFSDVLKMTQPEVSGIKASKATAEALEGLKISDNEKYGLIADILKKNSRTYSKTAQGVSLEMQDNFVGQLMKMDKKLLQNVTDNNIPIRLYDDISLYTNVEHAAYGTDGNVKIFQFSERNAGEKITVSGKKVSDMDSMGHEFGHAFDYNYNNTNNARHLTAMCEGIEPNAEKSFWNGKKLKTQKDGVYNVHLDNPSFSKEFEDAFSQDYTRMMDLDIEKGLREGTIFDEMLKNPKAGYYLGGVYDKQGNLIRMQADIAKLELFAQGVSKVTTGETADPTFNEHMADYFPNILEFVRSLF